MTLTVSTATCGCTGLPVSQTHYLPGLRVGGVSPDAQEEGAHSHSNQEAAGREMKPDARPPHCYSPTRPASPMV